MSRLRHNPSRIALGALASPIPPGPFFLCSSLVFLSQLRSFFSRAIAARSSGIPAPDRDEVGSTLGNAAGRFLSAASMVAIRSRELGCFDLVRLGQHDLMADGGFAQRIKRRRVGVLQPVPRIDQHIDAGEVGAAAQVHSWIILVQARTLSFGAAAKP